MTYRNALVACVAVIAMSACKTEDKAAESPTVEPAPAEAEPAPEPKEAPAAVLAIEAAKLKIDKGKNNPDGPSELTLDASGDIKADGKVVAKVSANGKLIDANGKEGASIDATGKVTFAGEPETLVIAEDGTTTKNGEEIVKIGDGGALTGKMTKQMSEKLVYEGPPTARRAMMFVYFAAIMPAQPSKK